jgi:hypothetical protein
MTLRKPKASKVRNRASRLMQFRQEIDHIDPELLRLLELLNSTAPGPQMVVVRTALTYDTKSPWGQQDGRLERNSIGM